MDDNVLPTEVEEPDDPEFEARVARRYQLGRIAESSANMETVLRAIFSSLLGSPRANVVAAGQSVTWLIDNALAVIDANEEVRAPSLGDPENVARFRGAIERLRNLNTRRNQLLHGTWVDSLPDGRPGQSVLLSKWRQPRPFAMEVSISDIEMLAEELDKAVDDLVTSAFNVSGVIAGT